MSDEVTRMCAERLTANSWDVYLAGSPPRDYREIADVILADGRAVAKVYIAENPADNDDFIMPEWLIESVGFRQSRPDEKPGWYDFNGFDFYHYSFPFTWVRFHNYELPHIKKRGQFRRLCAALGIELKEQPCPAK